MLVLTRRVDAGDHSTIKIGHDVEVTLVDVRGEQVRIGSSAPPATTVHRSEVYEQIQQGQHGQAASEAVKPAA